MGNLTEKRIDAMLDERRQLRDELILFQKSHLGYYGPVLIVGLSAAFVSTITKDALHIFGMKKSLILILLNQALFYLFVFFSLVRLNEISHNLYIARIERDLNRVFNEPTCYWTISGEAFRPTFFAAAILMGILTTAGFIVLVGATYWETKNKIILLINLFELLILGGIWSVDFLHGEKHYQKKLEKTEKHIRDDILRNNTWDGIK